MIKAEWTNADALDLQPTCNQLATDLISRQAAIDALDGEIKVAGEANAKAVLKYTQMVSNRIKALPSAQPEPRWIPVAERLPEKYIGQWLCYTSDGDIMILPYDTPGDGTKECVFYKWDDDGYYYQTFDVIAWMPLPRPYERSET